MTVSVQAEKVTEYNGLTDWNGKGDTFLYRQSVTERHYDSGNTFFIYNDAKRYGEYEGTLSINNEKFSVYVNGNSYEKLKWAMIHQGDMMLTAYKYLKSLGFEISISKENAQRLHKKITDCDKEKNEKFKRFVRGAIRDVLNDKDKEWLQYEHV
jgi:hypothetical protein